MGLFDDVDDVPPPSDEDMVIGMALADYDADQKALEARIVRALATGRHSPEAMRWIAALFDPKGDSIFKLKLVKRAQGGVKQIQQSNPRYERLGQLWSETSDKAKFEELAAAQEDISLTAARRWRRLFERGASAKAPGKPLRLRFR